MAENNTPKADDDATGRQSAQEPDRQAQPVDDEQPPRLPFPVVGIGASAGGLEAVSQLLEAMRPDGGMAFVLVQHLPPDRASQMAEILARRTAMPVAQVEDGMAVEVDHLYVIRPGHVLTIRDGRLHLGPPLGTVRSANRPIDDFFKSLAEEQRERAVCVILSGMGSNGTAGAQSVKAVGGLCVAQDPETAQFPSMPRHLIDAGYADYVLSPGEIPEALLTFAGSPYARGGREADAREILRREEQHLREILAILRTRTKKDFNGYKKPTVLRRVQRRMSLARSGGLAEYARHLRQSPSEVTTLADDLLIHVSGFFRDPEAWEALRQRAVVPLVAAREPGAPVRAWVTACSSGEEAYSLAILLVEESDRAGKNLDVKVFATDLAERPLANARAGLYPGGIESEISPERLARFFQKEDEVYRVRQELRDRVVFAPQNVLQDPPFSRIDVASCRNLLIYLEPEAQRRVLALLHFGLREGGTLFLGSSETVAGVEELFEPLDKRARIFRRVGPTRHGMVEFPPPHSLPAVSVARPRARRDEGARPSLAQAAQQALLAYHTPAAVAVDRDHRVLYFHGDTSPYLLQPTGELTRDLLLLARQGVRGAVRAVLSRAAAENAPAVEADAWVDAGPGRRVRVAVTASPIPAVGPEGGAAVAEHFLVSFADRGEALPAAEPGAGGDHSADEFRRLWSELQSTIEELQTSNEELKASHEEVVSVNEELQASNEELETSKEEMQSLNEELHTVNAQLRAKAEEHQGTSGDLQSLLASTDIAVLFLDPHLRIRRYTPAARELIDLIPGDVGRPLGALNRKFEDPNLEEDCRTVLERLVPAEREVPGEGGKHYLRRAHPYRTADSRIDGVVVTLVDVTVRKQAEEALRASEEQFRRAIEDAPIPVIMQAEDGRVLQVSRTWTELTGYTLEDVPTADAWLTRAYGPGADAVRAHTQELFRGARKSLDVEFAIRTRAGAERHWSFSASAPGSLRDGRRFLVGMAVDITERKQAEAALREGEAWLRGQREALEAALNGGPLEASLGALVRTATDALGEGTRAAFYLANAEGTALRHVVGMSAEYAEAVPGFEIGAESLACGLATHTGEPVLTADVTQDPRWERWRGMAERFGYRGCWSFPIHSTAGRFVGTFAVYSRRPREATRRDRELASFLTHTASIILSRHSELEARVRAEMALRESEERLRLILASATDFAIFTLNGDRTVTSWSPGAAAMFGHAEAEIVGRPADVLFTPEDRAAGAPAAETEKARRDGRASDERWHLRKDDSRFYASGVLTPLGPGGAGGFVKVLHDLTERKRLEDELRRSRDELEERVRERTAELVASQEKALQAERLAAIGQTVTALAHEGRNALQRVASCLSRLEMRQEGRPDELALTGRAQQALGDLERLFDDVRTYAAPIRVDFKACDLSVVWRQAWAQATAAHAHRDARLEEETAAAAPECEADSFRLAQVFTNLFANALEACPDPVRVTVAWREAELGGRPVLRVSVRDNGPGFPEEQRRHLFEPFRTTKPTGTGLGMAITRRIVEAHGGEVAVGDGPGAEVVITLPRSRAHDLPI